MLDARHMPASHAPPACLCSQACSRSDYVCVPLYDSLGEQAVQHIIKHAHTRVVFSAAEKLAPLVSAIKGSPSIVRAVIYWGEPNPDAEKVAALLAGIVALHSCQTPWSQCWPQSA